MDLLLIMKLLENNLKNWVNNKVEFNLYKKILDCLPGIFFKWCLDNNYDRRKIQIITSLIFLNIAALHHTLIPFTLFFRYRMLNELI